MGDDCDWQHAKTPYFFGAQPMLIDGGKADRGAHVMRRRIPNGSWQYRLPTQEEASEWNAEQIW